MSDKLTPITDELDIVSYMMSYIFQRDKGYGISTDEIVQIFQERGFAIEIAKVDYLCKRLFSTGIIVKHVSNNKENWSLIFGRGPAYPV